MLAYFDELVKMEDPVAPWYEEPPAAELAVGDEEDWYGTGRFADLQLVRAKVEWRSIVSFWRRTAGGGRSEVKTVSAWVTVPPKSLQRASRGRSTVRLVWGPTEIARV